MGRAFNKIAVGYHMYLEGYKYYVLPDVAIIHRGKTHKFDKNSDPVRQSQ